MISGFPNESEDDHKQTLSLMDKVKYSFGYMFKYSERPGTLAAKKLEDNVDEKTKSRRLSEIVDLQQKHSMYRSKQFIGKTVEVLIEKESKNYEKMVPAKSWDHLNTITVPFFAK